MPENQLVQIEAKIDRLASGQEELRGDVRALQAGQVRHEERMHKLEIIHEDTMDAIKQIAESHAATQILLQKGFDDLSERIDRRLEPLEATVRDHSAILRKHNLTA